jgi:hypothetical protein
MRAEAIGREVFVARATVDGKGPSAMVKPDHVFGLDVTCRTGINPLRHLYHS